MDILRTQSQVKYIESLGKELGLKDNNVNKVVVHTRANFTSFDRFTKKAASVAIEHLLEMKAEGITLTDKTGELIWGDEVETINSTHAKIKAAGWKDGDILNEFKGYSSLEELSEEDWEEVGEVLT